MQYVGKFEECLARKAREVGADGVVCGHIHKPDVRVIDGIHYYNDGDWVDSCTALVEHVDGRMEILLIGRENPRTHADPLPPEAPVSADELADVTPAGSPWRLPTPAEFTAPELD